MSRPPQMPAPAPPRAPTANSQVEAPLATATAPDTARPTTMATTSPSFPTRLLEISSDK